MLLSELVSEELTVDGAVVDAVDEAVPVGVLLSEVVPVELAVDATVEDAVDEAVPVGVVV